MAKEIKVKIDPAKVEQLRADYGNVDRWGRPDFETIKRSHSVDLAVTEDGTCTIYGGSSKNRDDVRNILEKYRAAKTAADVTQAEMDAVAPAMATERQVAFLARLIRDDCGMAANFGLSTETDLSRMTRREASLKIDQMLNG